MKKIRNYLTLLFLLCCMLIGWMEILLRLKGNFYTYSEKAENKYVAYYNARLPASYHVYGANSVIQHHRAEFSYPFTANSLGLREKELKTEKPDSVCRVLFLGDSFTEGVGAPYDSSYPNLFGKYLAECNITAEIINAGISGSDPFYCFRLFEDKLLKYHPDMVLLAINASDITDYIYRGGMERFQADGTVRFRKGPWWEVFYRFSHFARWCVHNIFLLDETFTNKSNAANVEAEAREKIAECITAFRQLCLQQHCGFIAVIHPVPVEYRYGFSMKNDIRPLQQTLLASGVNSISLYEYLGNYLNRKNITECYWETDGHYNGKGYAYFAQSVIELLELQSPGLLNALCNEKK